MKTIFIMCGVILAACAALVWHAVGLPSHYGTFTGAPKVEVAALAVRPGDYLRKTVLVEGTIREQCQSMGCYFLFRDGQVALRVDLQEIAMTAPRREGRPARVEGQVVAYGAGYQLLASAVEFE